MRTTPAGQRSPSRSESLIPPLGYAVIVAFGLGVGLTYGVLSGARSWDIVVRTIGVGLLSGIAILQAVTKLLLVRIAKEYCASRGWQYVAAQRYNEHDALVYREGGDTKRLKFRLVNKAIVPLQEPRVVKKAR